MVLLDLETALLDLESGSQCVVLPGLRVADFGTRPGLAVAERKGTLNFVFELPPEREMRRLGYLVLFRQAIVIGVVCEFRVGRSLSSVEVDRVAVRDRLGAILLEPGLELGRAIAAPVVSLLREAGVRGIWYGIAITSTFGAEVREGDTMREPDLGLAAGPVRDTLGAIFGQCNKC